MNFFNNIIAHFNFYIFFLILFISLLGIFYKQQLFQKLIFLSIFQTNIIIFFLSISYTKNLRIPIIDLKENFGKNDIIFNNPLPHVLMLTAIVVGIATFALGLAIILKKNHTQIIIETKSQ